MVTLIIPAYNGAKYIAETIAGVNAQDAAHELIVVDDCSTDDTASIAESLGARVIRHTENRGQVIGKNTGVRAARGEYIVFNDQDDIMRPGTLSRLLAELDADQSAAAVMGKSLDFLSPDATVPAGRARTAPVWGMFSGATMFRKSTFDTIGLFDETVKLNTGETMIIQNKMQEHGLTMKKIDFIAVDRRIHDNNFGITNPAKEYQDYATVLRQRLRK